MHHGRDKYRSRANRARIRELFMREWDPIGVEDIPEAYDEYDNYVGEAYAMPMYESASADDLTRYLLGIENPYGAP
jgi:hypothetical protein